MKKLIILTSLFASLGGVMMNSQPTNTLVVDTPLRAAVTTSYIKEEPKSFMSHSKTIDELNIVTDIKLPSADDYKDLSTFNYGGFLYSRTSNTLTRYSDNEVKDTIETVMLINLKTATDTSLKNDTFDGSDFPECKTLITDEKTDISKFNKLETLIILGDYTFTKTLPSSLKNIVFLGMNSKSMDFSSVSNISDTNLALLKNYNLITDEAHKYRAAWLIDSINNNLSYEESYKLTSLHIVESNKIITSQSCNKDFSHGGICYGNYENDGIFVLYTEKYATTATIEEHLFKDVKYSKINTNNTTKLENLYWNQNYIKGSTNSCAYNITTKNLIIKNACYLNPPLFKNCENIIIENSDTDVSFSSGGTLDSSINVYVLDGTTKYNDSRYTTKTYHNGDYDFTQKLEIKVNNQIKTSTDLTKYDSLVKEALNIKDSINDDTTDEDKDDTDKENQEASDVVIQLIKDISEVNINSREVILKAKEAYEELTYTQQKLVTNKKDLEDSIEKYNALIVDDENEKPIEKLKSKTIIDKISENKTTKLVATILGSITGLLILYLIYKLIRKFTHWLKR